MSSFTTSANVAPTAAARCAWSRRYEGGASEAPATMPRCRDRGGLPTPLSALDAEVPRPRLAVRASALGEESGKFAPAPAAAHRAELNRSRADDDALPTASGFAGPSKAASTAAQRGAREEAFVEATVLTQRALRGGASHSESFELEARSSDRTTAARAGGGNSAHGVPAELIERADDDAPQPARDVAGGTGSACDQRGARAATLVELAAETRRRVAGSSSDVKRETRRALDRVAAAGSGGGGGGEALVKAGAAMGRALRGLASSSENFELETRFSDRVAIGAGGGATQPIQLRGGAGSSE